jgi:hypothetical protein
MGLSHAALNIGGSSSTHSAVLVISVVGALAAGGLTAGRASSLAGGQEPLTADLVAVPGSHVGGTVRIGRTPLGARIEIEASGLDPGGQYVSVLHRNDACALEPDSLSANLVAQRYVATPRGTGHASGFTDFALDGVLSISVLRGPPALDLVACATPGR